MSNLEAMIPIQKHFMSEKRAERFNGVNARDLHKALEVGKDFNTWIKDRIQKYGFIENEDFVILQTPQTLVHTKTGRPGLEYVLGLDMAKEISMIENNDKGMDIRKYFIACEKNLIARTLSLEKLQGLARFIGENEDILSLMAELDEKLLSKSFSEECKELRIPKGSGSVYFLKESVIEELEELRKLRRIANQSMKDAKIAQLERLFDMAEKRAEYYKARSEFYESMFKKETE